MKTILIKPNQVCSEIPKEVLETNLIGQIANINQKDNHLKWKISKFPFLYTF